MLLGGVDPPVVDKPHASVRFSQYRWDGRLFIHNSGRARRFAAARLLARRHNHRVPIKGVLDEYVLDQEAVRALCQRFRFVLIGEDYENNSSSSFIGSFEHSLEKNVHRVDDHPMWFRFECPATGQTVLAFDLDDCRVRALSDLILSNGGVDYGRLLTNQATCSNMSG